MPLTLEQYSTWLDARDLPWPSSPVVEKPSARPHLTRLPDVRAILWNVYGTLLAIPGGELWFVHPKPIIMNMVLEKTIQEFKMWGSMSRKPGQPSEYMGKIYEQVLLEQKAFPAEANGFRGGRPNVSGMRFSRSCVRKITSLIRDSMAGSTIIVGKLPIFFTLVCKERGVIPALARR